MHVIFGAGLVGGYLGTALVSRGERVSFIARPHVQEKFKNGITLTDYENNQFNIASLNFLTNGNFDRAATDIEYIWITVKCGGVANAIKQLKPYVSDNTVIFCCQNGLGSEQPVKAAFPENLVCRVMVPFNVVELDDGHLHRGTEGSLAIEDQPNLNLDALIKQIQSPLLPVVKCKKMSELLWAKLQLNLANSINALADIPVKSMLQQRGYRLVIAAMMGELLTVAKQKNIALPKLTSVPAHWLPKVLSLPTFLFKLVANKMLNIDPNARTSMWWDLHNQKQTEIDYLNGAIVKVAAELGIDCPVNKKTVALVKQIETAQQRGQPRETYSAEQLAKLVL